MVLNRGSDEFELKAEIQTEKAKVMKVAINQLLRGVREKLMEKSQETKEMETGEGLNEEILYRRRFLKEQEGFVGRHSEQDR